MQPQWFYLLQGKSHGPVTLAEIRRLFKSQRLKPTDSIRHARDGGWMGVAEFLASQAPQIQESELDEEVGAQAVALPASGPGVLESALARGRESFDDVFTALTGLFSGSWELLKRLPELRQSWITVAGLAVIGLAYFLKDVDFLRNDTQQATTQLVGIGEELRLLQGRQASAADWDEFQQAARATLNPLHQQLLVDSRKNPRLRSQYWTAAGYRQSVERAHLIQACESLKRMVDAQGGDDRLRGTFQRRMDLARVPLGFEKQTAPAVANNWDLMTIGMIVFDAAIVLGAVGFWWIRRTPRMSQAQ